MTAYVPPVPADGPGWLTQLLTALRNDALERAAPGRPQAVFACRAGELPPPGDYRHCQAILTDARRLVISTYSGSAWEWTNADGSPL